MKNKLFLFFMSWWLAALIMPLIVLHRNFQYDAAGFEGSFWWATFLISFPFGIAGEYVGDIFSNFNEVIQTAITFIFGSIFIFIIFLSTSYFMKSKSNFL